jgi:hypothetical protein
MQLAVVLTCLGILVTGAALAEDPPESRAASGNDAPSPVQQPAAASAADPAALTEKPAAAAASTAIAAGAEPDMAQLEKRMHAMGYSTVMQNGQKYFCRRDEVLGTRLGATNHCMTPNEAVSNRQAQDFEFLQQRLMTTCVQAGAHKPANCGN